MGITILISLYTTRLILNGLGVSDFGIYNLVGGSIAMLGFLNTAMASATQRFMSYAEGAGDKEKKTTIFNISLVLHFVSSVLVGLLLLIAGLIFFNGLLDVPEDRNLAAKVIYGCLIISTMFSVITVPYDAVMNAHENMKYYALVGILESILKLLVAIICIYASYDKLIVYGILMSIIPLISLSIMRLYCHRNYSECRIRIRQSWDKTLAKKMISFAGWNVIGTSSSMVGNYGLNLVINNFFGVVINAVVGITSQLCGIIMNFSSNMLKALNPVITKTEGAGEREKMLQLSSTGNKMSFIILSIISMPLLVETNYILELWLVNIPEWTVLFVKLQIIRGLAEQLTYVYHTSINAHGNIRTYNIIISFVNIIPIVLTFLLFSLGAEPYIMYIINILIFGIFVSGLRIYFMHQNCGLSYYSYIRKEFFPLLVSTICCLLLCYHVTFLSTNNIFRLILVILTSIIGGGMCYYILAFNKSEKITIKLTFTGIVKQIKRIN